MEENNQCNCPKTKCTRHGKCDECRKHHAEHKKYPPFCDRQKQKEHKREQRAQERSR